MPHLPPPDAARCPSLRCVSPSARCTAQAAQIAAELAAARSASHDTEGVRQQLAGAQRQNESAAEQNAALVRAEAQMRVRHEALVESSNDERAAHAAAQSESLAVQRQLTQELQRQSTIMEERTAQHNAEVAPLRTATCAAHAHAVCTCSMHMGHAHAPHRAHLARAG